MSKDFDKEIVVKKAKKEKKEPVKKLEVAKEDVIEVKEEKVVEKKEIFGLVNTHALNFRQGPGFEYKNVTQKPVLTQNTKVKILEDKKDWYFIEVGGLHGYVRAEFISVK